MQRIINILVLVLIGFSIYYGVIVDFQRVQTMKGLETSDVELQGHKKVIDEEYKRINLRFVGRGKHIRRMQDDIAALGQRIKAVTDSLGNKIEETDYYLRQVEETLSRDIRDVSSELRTLGDEVSTYKRRTNRSILDIQETISRIEDDIKALQEPPVEDEE